MSKADADRWNETIKYLNDSFPDSGLGTHIEMLVLENKRGAVSREISLGTLFDFKLGRSEAEKKRTRHALRGLLLCQRVYFSEFFCTSETSVNSGQYSPTSHLPSNWKEASLAYWKNKLEVQIKRGIAMFVVNKDASAAIELKNAANKGRYLISLPGNLKLSRDDKDLGKTGSVSCYGAVMTWLVRSGIVSLRWYLQNPGPNNETGLTAMFGKGTTIWRGKLAGNKIEEARKLIKGIPPGSIVHMYCEDYGAGGWKGHWMITNGDSKCTACGANNAAMFAKDTENDKVVDNSYTNTAILWEQFKGYGGGINPETRVDKTGELIAVMVVINPMCVPNRM